MKTALTVPPLPSVTVTSLIGQRGDRVVVGDRADALRVCDGRVDRRPRG